MEANPLKQKMKFPAAEGRYIPQGVEETWLAMNFKLLPTEEEVKKVDMGTSAPYQLCYLAFRNKGYERIIDIEDTEWLKTVAFNLDESIPRYSVVFCKIVEDFLFNRAKDYVVGRCKPYFSAVKRLDKKRKRHSFGPNTIRKLIKEYGEDEVDGLCKKIIRRVVAPCKVCNSNSTEGMRILQCCGKPLHSACMRKGVKKNCPHCKVATSLGKKMHNLDDVFVSKTKYKELKEEYEENAKGGNGSIADELKELVRKYGEDELRKALGAKE